MAGKNILNRRASVYYWKTIPEDDFTRELSALMTQHSISAAELARRVGVSRPYVTKILQGGANWTLETLTKFALAFNCVPRLHLAPQEASTVWRDVHNSSDSESATVFYPLEFCSDQYGGREPKQKRSDISVTKPTDTDYTSDIKNWHRREVM